MSTRQRRAPRARRCVGLSLSALLLGPGLAVAGAAPASCNGFTAVHRPPFGRAGLLPEAASRPPGVFVSEITGRVRRLDGATGSTRWGANDNGITSAALRAGRGTSVVSVTPGDCGEVTVTARDAVTGARRWSTTQPGHGNAALPDAHFLLPGTGDLDGDGWADVAVLETSSNDTVGAGNNAIGVGIGYPSGQAGVLTAPWRAGYVVMNGRTGKLLVRRALGTGTGPFPMMAWAGSRLVVAVPVSATSTNVTAVGPKGPLWNVTVGAAVSDVDLRSLPGRILVREGASYGAGTFAGTLQALDLATGATAWSMPLGGHNLVSVGSRGEVYAYDHFPGGKVMRLDAATGLPLWVQPALGTFNVLTPLGDFDGDGLADAFVAGVASNTVLSSKDGRALLTLPSTEDAYPVGDLDGDRREDLLTIDWDDLIPGNHSPVVTVRLRHGLGAAVWTRRVTVCAGGLLNVLAAGGANGSVLLHDTGCPTVVLASRTGKERWRLPA